MADRYYRAFPDPRRLRVLYQGASPAATIVDAELFDAPQPPGQGSLYLGAAGQSVVFLGARTPAQVTLGTRPLF